MTAQLPPRTPGPDPMAAHAYPGEALVGGLFRLLTVAGPAATTRHRWLLTTNPHLPAASRLPDLADLFGLPAPDVAARTLLPYRAALLTRGRPGWTPTGPARICPQCEHEEGLRVPVLNQAGNALFCARHGQPTEEVCWTCLGNGYLRHSPHSRTCRTRRAPGSWQWRHAQGQDTREARAALRWHNKLGRLHCSSAEGSPTQTEAIHELRRQRVAADLALCVHLAKTGQPGRLAPITYAPPPGQLAATASGAMRIVRAADDGDYRPVNAALELINAHGRRARLQRLAQIWGLAPRPARHPWHGIIHRSWADVGDQFAAALQATPVGPISARVPAVIRLPGDPVVLTPADYQPRLALSVVTLLTITGDTVTHVIESIGLQTPAQTKVLRTLAEPLPFDPGIVTATAAELAIEAIDYPARRAQLGALPEPPLRLVKALPDLTRPRRALRVWGWTWWTGGHWVNCPGVDGRDRPLRDTLHRLEAALDSDDLGALDQWYQSRTTRRPTTLVSAPADAAHRSRPARTA